MLPTLYLQKIDNKKFNQYSRMCPFSDRRQPIILTDKELEKIDKESPGSYKKILKFGSDTNNKYSYICPRYWDIKRWKLADDYFNRPIKGWNIFKSDVQSFYEVKNIFNRKYLKRDYLWPISQNELLRNPNLVQNPGW